MSARKKQYISQDLSSRDLMGSVSVMASLDCSKSHLLRLTHGQIKTATPFPKPFRIGTKNNYWRRAELVAWIDAEQAAAK